MYDDNREDGIPNRTADCQHRRAELEGKGVVEGGGVLDGDFRWNELVHGLSCELEF